MRIDLGVLRPPDGGVDRRRAYEVKTTSFCASHYRVREHTGGLTWADFRARDAVRERERQAAHIDAGLFRGSQPAPMATALAHLGGVEALVLGGCCELNATAPTPTTQSGQLPCARNRSAWRAMRAGREWRYVDLVLCVAAGLYSWRHESPGPARSGAHSPDDRTGR